MFAVEVTPFYAAGGAPDLLQTEALASWIERQGSVQLYHE
jgi:hypothetical protein